MNITDPIADLLTRIRNAQKAAHDVVVVPASKEKIAITSILADEGFIRAFKCIRDKKQGLIKIALKYDEENGSPVISEIKRVSRPGRRVYIRADKIPMVKNGFGMGVFSTSQGIMSSREAQVKGIGGEYLCSVY
jgi:small subunit ribosomal protein S8